MTLGIDNRHVSDKVWPRRRNRVAGIAPWTSLSVLSMIRSFDALWIWLKRTYAGLDSELCCNLSDLSLFVKVRVVAGKSRNVEWQTMSPIGVLFYGLEKSLPKLWTATRQGTSASRSSMWELAFMRVLAGTPAWMIWHVVAYLLFFSHLAVVLMSSNWSYM
jgi:hypothetical protein